MKTVKITYDEYIAIITMIKHESKYYIPEDRAEELYNMFLDVCPYVGNDSFELQVASRCI